MSSPPQASAGADWRDGLVDILPVVLAAAPIGLVFGALAAAKGLSAAEVALLSATVFAGGAQFAALEIWAHPPSVLLLAFSALLINARHVLMGVSLTAKTGHWRPAEHWLGYFFMTDETWALAERRARQRRLGAAYWIASGALLWLQWVFFSTVGAMGGSVLGDPKRFGADFAFTAVFIALVAGFWKGRVTAAAVVVAGTVSALVYVAAGPPWHVATGALAGIAAAYFAAAPDPVEEPAQ